MGFDQYHEPPEELSAQTRTFARMCANLTEEAEAIGWYEQRISVEPDPASRAIMYNSLGEEFKHFSMELEYLFRAKPVWRETARGILFQDGDIVANGEASEAAVDSGTAPADAPQAGAMDAMDTSLGIGSLKGPTL
ncbi:ferritin family protein [Arthrobacter sp. A5]|uniref:ferritin family protein n=1 Tax=Arthrobacter sp. A5 TaxID=576926 RepID=UPI003DA9F7F8